MRAAKIDVLLASGNDAAAEAVLRHWGKRPSDHHHTMTGPATVCWCQPRFEPVVGTNCYVIVHHERGC